MAYKVDLAWTRALEGGLRYEEATGDCLWRVRGRGVMSPAKSVVHFSFRLVGRSKNENNVWRKKNDCGPSGGP
jgi:hypothetical protein